MWSACLSRTPLHFLFLKNSLKKLSSHAPLQCIDRSLRFFRFTTQYVGSLVGQYYCTVLAISRPAASSTSTVPDADGSIGAASIDLILPPYIFDHRRARQIKGRRRRRPYDQWQPIQLALKLTILY